MAHGDVAAHVLRVAEAHAAHARGWLLTPLRGKRPILKGWSTAPAPTEDDVRRWAREGNLGLRTGSASGVVVIDDDTPGGSGESTLALPNTPTVITGSGRRHLYFRAPARPLGNSVGKLALGIDVRADRGQAVLAGSLHPNTGRPYLWAEGLTPNDIPLAELPPSVLHTLTRRASRRPSSPIVMPPHTERGLTRYATRALERAAHQLAATPEGARNDALNRVAFVIGRFVGASLLAHDLAWHVLAHAADATGLPRSESERTLRSGLDAGVLAPFSSPSRDAR